MDPKVVLPTILGTALVFVVAPVVGSAIAEARGPHPITCPETQGEAVVKLDGKRAALAVFVDRPPRVTGCSLWPEKAGCARACEADL